MRRGTKWLLVLGVFLFLFLVVGIVAALSLGGSPRVPARAVLWVKLGSEITEEEQRSPFDRIFGHRALALRDYVQILHAARSDKRIQAVVIEASAFGGGWGMAHELRDAIAELGRSGKKVIAYIEAADDRDYFIASGAQRIVMLPSGMLMVTGIMADVSFYRGTLDKIGIEPDLEHIGAYKSASDVYMRSSMSDAQREATNLILDGLYDGFLSQVGESRSLEPGAVAAAVDVGFLTAERAKELKLVDDLRYEDELWNELKGDASTHPERIKAGAYFEALGEPRTGARIALVYVTGVIVPGSSRNDPLAGSLAGSETIAEALRKVREDSSIKAVVLRVDSPGGSGLASDVIWRELALTRKQKPIVVSMGDLAASGGYYVSMGADAIVAQPATLTGSIGVISGKFSLRGFYDWIALKREQLKRGENADMFSDYQKFSAGQRALLRAQMDVFYHDFVRKAAEGRGKKEEEIDALGQGRVWTGAQAKERGLVDELGGLERAIELAKQKAGIPEGRGVRLETFPKPRGLFESLVSWGSDDSSAGRTLASLLPGATRTTLAALRIRDLLSAEPYLCLDESLAGMR